MSQGGTPPISRRIRARLISEEQGFSLIELLAVILIIGILCSIVLTTFFGHKDRGEDAKAKSNARVLVTQVESCFTANEDYRECDDLAELTPPEVPYGIAPGQASVVDATKMSYEIEGYSESMAGGARHTFKIKKDVATGVIDQTCTPTGSGGCPESGSW